MRILVYGAGVIGCELAHVMNVNHNEVTLLARGDWKEHIETNGLVIKHCGYFHTSIDHISVIDSLQENDAYDFIFVVMTYHNVQDIIPSLKRNCSKRIIFIGNNASPELYEHSINDDSVTKKEVMFGFTGIGGLRKQDKILSMHPLKFTLTLGELKSLPSKDTRVQIDQLFQNTICQIEWQDNMQGWLLAHLASILPSTYICYHQNFHLFQTKLETIDLIIDAIQEANQMLHELGFIIPEFEDTLSINERKKKRRKLFLLFKTPAGKFVIGNHCKHGIREMIELDQTFELLRMKANVPMPAWNTLRNLSQPAKEQSNI